MWQVVSERLPSGQVILCTVLTAAVPLGIHFANEKLHQIGDPAWKKNQDDNREPE